MSSRIYPMDNSFVRLLAGSLLSAGLLAGCVASAGVASPTAANASSSPADRSPAPSAAPSGSSAGGFYLRAWQYQAVPPEYTFSWLPVVTIADGSYINGRVAVPDIYPGPIYIELSARPISAEGIDSIVAKARADGLLGDKSDFTGAPMPGSKLAYIRLVVDGVAHDLTGPLLSDATSAGGGTADAFLDFWNFISAIDGWIGTELGQSSPYSPTSVAVMLTPPTEAKGAIVPTETPWPLASTFAAFGKQEGSVRCATVTGTDLATLLPVIKASNQLTRFVDSTGAKASLQARALVPGESGPCA